MQKIFLVDLLLADAFTSFRNVYYDIYGLDPAQVLSAPV